MPDCDVANLVTVTKTTMIDEMPCGDGTPTNNCGQNTAPSSLESCTEVSTALEVSHRPG